MSLSTQIKGTSSRVMPLRARRGAALLEVVVSLSILLLSMAIVGMAFRNGSLYVEKAERMSRAQEVTQRLLGQISTGLVAVGEQEAIGTFGDETYPGMCWRVQAVVAPDTAGLINIIVSVFMGTPESREEEREHVLTTYVQQATFEPLNMQRDFGMTTEQTDKMLESVPGGSAVFDPTSFDPRALARLDLEMLKELLPVLIQAFGGEGAMGQLDDLLKAVEGGDIGKLQQLGQQMQQIGQPQGQQGASPDAPPQFPGQSPGGDTPTKRRDRGNR